MHMWRWWARGFKKIVTLKMKWKSCPKDFDIAVESNDNGGDNGGMGEEVEEFSKNDTSNLEKMGG